MQVPLAQKTLLSSLLPTKSKCKTHSLLLVFQKALKTPEAGHPHLRHVVDTGMQAAIRVRSLAEGAEGAHLILNGLYEAVVQ